MKKSNTMKLCAAWLLVGLPLTWGVYKTVQKSLPLFGVQTVSTAPAAGAGGR